MTGMRWLAAAAIFVVGPAAAAEMDVPYVTSPHAVTAAMLDIAKVGVGDRLIDLGSGDGRIVIAAAKRGATALGIEIDPRLVAQSRAAAARAGVAARATFRDDDLFKTDLAGATVITMYLLPDVNLALRPRLLALAPGTRIVSHDWDLGDWQPDAERRVAAPEKKLGLEKSSRVMRWTVPAQVGGRWCGPGGEWTISQRYQVVEAAGPRGERRTGRLDGTAIQLGIESGRVEGGAMRLGGKPWRRATGPCPAGA